MKVKLFGLLGAFIAPEVEVVLPEQLDKNTVLTALSVAFPTHADEFIKCNVAVNQVYIFDESVDTSSVNEIAIIPPVSGG
jgi:molybdopterin converting factor small subunit